MYLVDFKRCSFKKEGNTIEYYRCVLTDLEGDYSVKSMTKECYVSLRNSYDEHGELFTPTRVNNVFYDEHGRICKIEF